jgi:uncharacterized protein (TIGR03067 family)
MIHLLGCLCLVLPSGPTTDAAEELAGNWRMSSFIVNGDKIPTDVANKLRIIVTGDTMTMRGSIAGNGKRYLPIVSVTVYKMTLGISNGVKTIDLTPVGEGRPMRGIYKLEDGKLTLCLGMNNVRPSGFASKPNSSASLCVCKKE